MHLLEQSFRWPSISCLSSCHRRTSNHRETWVKSMACADKCPCLGTVPEYYLQRMSIPRYCAQVFVRAPLKCYIHIGAHAQVPNSDVVYEVSCIYIGARDYGMVIKQAWQWLDSCVCLLWQSGSIRCLSRGRDTTPGSLNETTVPWSVHVHTYFCGPIIERYTRHAFK